MNSHVTHPWISYGLQLQGLSWQGWTMLGECQSKCQHLVGEILYPETRDQLHTMYLSKGAQATVAIEGNTLSEEQVRQILNKKLQLPPSQAYLQTEVENVIGECNKIAQEIKEGRERTIDVETIKRMNLAILHGLIVDESIQPGKFRTVSVGVGRYLAPPPDECQILMERLCDWLNNDPVLNHSGEFEIAMAIVKAILAHLYIAWIHPFGDGNGRTARLVEFQILINAGIPGDAAHLLSNHYNQTRTQHYAQLDQSSKKKGSEGVLDFLWYSIQGFRDGLAQQLEVIKEYQRIVAWENYVHRFFARENSIASNRKKELVLGLTKSPEPLPLAKLTEVSPRVTMEYSKLDNRTLVRDLADLVASQLIIRKDDLFFANKELILAFLPTVKAK